LYVVLLLNCFVCYELAPDKHTITNFIFQPHKQTSLPFQRLQKHMDNITMWDAYLLKRNNPKIPSGQVHQSGILL